MTKVISTIVTAGQNRCIALGGDICGYIEFGGDWYHGNYGSGVAWESAFSSRNVNVKQVYMGRGIYHDGKYWVQRPFLMMR